MKIHEISGLHLTPTFWISLVSLRHGSRRFIQIPKMASWFWWSKKPWRTWTTPYWSRDGLEWWRELFFFWGKPWATHTFRCEKMVKTWFPAKLPWTQFGLVMMDLNLHTFFVFGGGGAIRRNPMTRQNGWQSMEVMTKCLATRSNPLQKKTKQGYHVISHTLNPKP